MRVRAYMRGLVPVCVWHRCYYIFAKLFSITAMFTYMFFHCVRCAVEDACMHINIICRGSLGPMSRFYAFSAIDIS